MKMMIDAEKTGLPNPLFAVWFEDEWMDGGKISFRNPRRIQPGNVGM